MNRIYIKNLTVSIITLQVITFILLYLGIVPQSFFVLSPGRVLQGEVWRIVTYMLLPSGSNPFWALLGWYFFYMMGTALEHYWGESKFNLYILISIVLTNITAFAFDVTIYTNDNIRNSIFLAFAFLNPNFQIMLFFLIPIKVKWIALVTWILYAIQFVMGGLGTKMLVLGAIINFLIFFSRDLYYKLRYGKRVVKTKIEKKIKEKTHFHRCDICGISDKDHPELEFRYCSLCNPPKCICENCLENHTH